MRARASDRLAEHRARARGASSPAAAAHARAAERAAGHGPTRLQPALRIGLAARGAPAARGCARPPGGARSSLSQSGGPERRSSSRGQAHTSAQRANGMRPSCSSAPIVQHRWRSLAARGAAGSVLSSHTD